MARSPNRLLASLPAPIFAAIEPHLKLAEIKVGDVIAETGSAVKHVYFPHSGAISLVVELNVGKMIETAMVGHDGVVNAASALNGKVSLNKAIVQMAGTASVIGVHKIRTITDEFKRFRSVLIHHEQILFAQSQQSAACNASHLVGARMCCWLLRMRDLADSDNLILTQKLLAQMIGVRQASVSLVAHALQKADLIKYKRGHIRILDLLGLKEGSCECYGSVKAHYDRLLVG